MVFSKEAVWMYTCGEWVEYMGVASGRTLRVVIRWVWLECIGVVSGWRCKEVYYRFPHVTYTYSTCISLISLLYNYVHFKNIFSFLTYLM